MILAKSFLCPISVSFIMRLLSIRALINHAFTSDGCETEKIHEEARLGFLTKNGRAYVCSTFSYVTHLKKGSFPPSYFSKVKVIGLQLTEPEK